MQSISKSELILMHIIWDRGGTALYAEIADGLHDRKLDWAKNTIITLLSRLADKGFLKTGKIGRRNEYKALVAESEYSAAETQSHIDAVYEGDVMGLINTLLQKNLIPREELDLLRRQWERGGEDE